MPEKETIDMRSGFPPHKEIKQLVKYAPRSWQLFFGKKYILPNYRAPYYAPQDFVNYMEWTNLISLPHVKWEDQIMYACFCNTATALPLGRPTLFLEKELGFPLIHAPLPEDMATEDFKWKWPGMRIYLPERLINLDDLHWLMYMDISLIEEDQSRALPKEIIPEVDNYSRFKFPEGKPHFSYANFRFEYPDRAIVVSGILNCVDGKHQSDIATYAMVKPFKKYTVAEIKAMTDHLKSAWKCDRADDAVTQQMEHLALHVLLFLSAYPLEYEQGTVLRKASVSAERHISALFKAKFVGQSQIRPHKDEPHHIASAVTVAGAISSGGEGKGGWTLSPHWRSGHWVRQPYGPKSGLRKLIWVNTMPVGYGDEKDDDSND